MENILPAYTIFTDATADLNDRMMDGLPRVEIIPMEVEFGADSYTFGPCGNITVQQFYAMQRAGKYASTTQINPMTYMDCFEKALGNGKDILYLCFSTGLSKTLQNAKYCAELLKQDYPDRRIIVIDTLCASAGEGFLVREAARKQAEGFTMDELAEWVLAHRLEVCHWFTVDTFDHLRHGGRVSAASAAIGNVLSIKPLLHVDEQGRLQVAKKPRGQRQAMRELLAHLDAGWNPDLGRAILVAHGDNPDGAAALTAEIRSSFPDADLIQGTIGPVIGAHTGPGMLAVLYWGTNR